MRFMVMVKTGENQGPLPKELMEAMAKHAQESGRAGALLQTGGLAPSAMGARVRVSAGKLTVTDGPFTEAKEVVGGYAVVEATSKEEAIEGASTWHHECQQRERCALRHSALHHTSPRRALTGAPSPPTLKVVPRRVAGAMPLPLLTDTPVGAATREAEAGQVPRRASTAVQKGGES